MKGFVRQEVDSRINRRIGQRLVPVSIASLIFSFARRIRHRRGTSKVRQCVYVQYVRLLFYPYAPCCLPKKRVSPAINLCITRVSPVFTQICGFCWLLDFFCCFGENIVFLLGHEDFRIVGKEHSDLPRYIASARITGRLVPYLCVT